MLTSVGAHMARVDVVAAASKGGTSRSDASKGERTRAAILTAAVARFAAEGFRRASIGDIARDVGITSGAVYRYFSDKEALFLAALDADTTALVDLVQVTFFDDLRATLAHDAPRLARRFTEALDHHPLAARALRGAEPMGPDRIQSLPHLRALRERVQVLVRDAQRAGVVRADVDAAQMALGFETIVLHQLAHLSTLDAAERGQEHERWTAIAAVLEAALRPSPP